MTQATLVRARELARTGTYADVDAIRARLREEGHVDADQIVCGYEVTAELGRLCRQAHIRVRVRGMLPQQLEED